MNEVTLTVEPRESATKGHIKRMRLEGHIPATVYGMNSEPVSVTVTRSDLRKALTTEAGVNALINLEIGGAVAASTVVKDIQRHPVRRDVIHVDFMRIDPDKAIQVEVPITVVGDAKAVTSAGGITSQSMQTLRAMVKPNNIPNEIQVDISAMTMDASITVADLNLPEGVEPVDPAEKPVVTASLTRAAIVAAQAARRAAEQAERDAKKKGK